MKDGKGKKVALSLLVALTVSSACFLAMQISAFMELSFSASLDRVLVQRLLETNNPLNKQSSSGDEALSSNHYQSEPANATSTSDMRGDSAITDTKHTGSSENATDLARRKAMIPTNPYRILTKGSPRTGTTFQFQLLQGIVSLKTPGQELLSGFLGERPNMLVDAFATNQSFVFKTHGNAFDSLFLNKTVAMFATANFIDREYAVYMQSLRRLRKCPSCEVRNYQPLFDLTDQQVHDLEQHMKHFSILRRCCGLQMSKFELFRLHNCNVSRFIHRLDYPHCEQQNLSHVEALFAASPVPFQPNDPTLNWERPGDCQRYRDRIRAGEAFNGCEFRGCTIEGILGLRNCSKSGLA